MLLVNRGKVKVSQELCETVQCVLVFHSIIYGCLIKNAMGNCCKKTLSANLYRIAIPF